MSKNSARSNAWRAAFEPPAHIGRPPVGMGHNAGPVLEGLGQFLPWRQALKKAWRRAPVDVVRRRIALAEETGLTYREYTLELLECGRWLVPEKDAERIGRIVAER